MQLSALNWTEPDMKHVITFELTGMEQDHGYNAIAIVINADDPNGTNDMFQEQGAGKLETPWGPWRISFSTATRSATRA